MRALRPVVERMKSLSKQVTLDAGHDGCLSLQIRSEHATIRTYYRGLRAMLAAGTRPPASCAPGMLATNPGPLPADAPEQLTQARAVATVDIKQLLSTLQFHTLPVDTAMCCACRTLPPAPVELLTLRHCALGGQALSQAPRCWCM